MSIISQTALPVSAMTFENRSTLVFPGLEKFYDVARPVSYAVLRVAFGAILVTHGLPKVLGTNHGSVANPLQLVTNYLDKTLHLPAPVLFAGFAAFLETGGALMLALGLLTRIVTPMIAVELAVACAFHYPVFAVTSGGFEYPLLMGFLALYISFHGGGRFSLDRLIGKEV